MSTSAVKMKLSRSETKELKYQSLMDAAVRVVGEKGYGGTSISRITETAGVSQGTFYYYFDDRQALFDALLPYVGKKMTHYIASDLDPNVSGIDREIAAFRSYCEFLAQNLGFYRILYESEVFAPDTHKSHMERMRSGYKKFLVSAQANNEIKKFSDAELDAIISFLIGARAYISMQYIENGKIPESAIKAYETLIKSGIT